MSKRLLRQQQMKMYKIVLQVTRQMMIPVGLTLLAILLFHYDDTLVKSFHCYRKKN
jgi:hypothetical protein